MPPEEQTTDPLLRQTGLNAAGRKARARKAINARWAKTVDRVAATQASRQKFYDRFERQVDPDGALDPQTRATLAANARKAYMHGLALKRAKKQQAWKRANGEQGGA